MSDTNPEGVRLVAGLRFATGSTSGGLPYSSEIRHGPDWERNNGDDEMLSLTPFLSSSELLGSSPPLGSVVPRI